MNTRTKCRRCDSETSVVEEIHPAHRAEWEGEQLRRRIIPLAFPRLFFARGPLFGRRHGVALACEQLVRFDIGDEPDVVIPAFRGRVEPENVAAREWLDVLRSGVRLRIERTVLDEQL